MTGLIHHLFEQYGAFGTGLGGAIEGESAVIIGGVLARDGLFSPWTAALMAIVGAWLSCQLFFLVGRSQRDARWIHSITEKPVFARALRMIERHPRLFCFGFRFIYGFRVAGPVAISMSSIKAREFAALQFLSALIWGPVLVWIGFTFGKSIMHFVHLVLTPEHALIAAAVGIALVLGYVQWRRRGAAARAAAIAQE